MQYRRENFLFQAFVRAPTPLPICQIVVIMGNLVLHRKLASSAVNYLSAVHAPTATTPALAIEHHYQFFRCRVLNDLKGAVFVASFNEGCLALMQPSMARLQTLPYPTCSCRSQRSGNGFSVDEIISDTWESPIKPVEGLCVPCTCFLNRHQSVNGTTLSVLIANRQSRHVSSLRVLMTMFALAIDSFAQQVISYRLQYTLVRFINSSTTGQWHYNDQLSSLHQGAVYGGLLAATPSTMALLCPTCDCRWQICSTLAVCSQRTDRSDLVVAVKYKGD